MTKKQHHKSHSEKEKEDWMNSKWRPMMGWMYMTVCACDFMVFPVLWSLLQSLSHGQVNSQWQPLTLQGAGLFHLAMGAVLGIAAYGRTQEKLNGANNGGLTQPGLGTTYVPPGQGQVNVSNQPNLVGGGFGGNAYGNTTTPATGFATGPTTFGSAPATGFGAPSGFGAPTASTAVTWPTVSTAPAAVTTGWGGKKAPPEPVFPEL
jgi:hypothetical protein